MQIIVIIALIFLYAQPSFAQGNFPSGSDNVEINLDALKPMSPDYSPPPMFEAPLTGIETEPLSVSVPETQTETHKKEQEAEYFDPPPIPPKRPKTLSVSQNYIDKLTQKQTQANTKNIEQVDNNDIDAEVVSLNAQNVLESISSNDITEAPPAYEALSEDIQAQSILPEDQIISIPFKIGSRALEKKDKSMLASAILPSLLRNPDLNLEIQSFASTNIEEKSARRMSLTRALEIREFLVEQGIPKERINIKALGDQTEKLPTDRADLYIFQ